MIWNKDMSLDIFNMIKKGSMVEHLGIEFIEYGDDYIKAKMPVDHRTKQPQGLLHGGASVALAETLGSIASVAVSENPADAKVVGVEINANHLKSAKSGFVYGVVKPIKVGRKIHVWNIEIKNEEDQLCCVSRLTVMVLS